MTRTLLLLRHAPTEAARPGGRDEARRLTEAGVAQAKSLGEWLGARYHPDAVLCSTAVRTRQTLALLDPGARAEFRDDLYNAGGDTIVAAIRELGPAAATGLVVGHAPGVPAVVHDLADPATSDRAALAVVASRFPAGTLAVLRFEGDWAGLRSAALDRVRLPTDQ